MDDSNTKIQLPQPIRKSYFTNNNENNQAETGETNSTDLSLSDCNKLINELERLAMEESSSREGSRNVSASDEYSNNNTLDDSNNSSNSNNSINNNNKLIQGEKEIGHHRHQYSDVLLDPAPQFRPNGINRQSSEGIPTPAITDPLYNNNQLQQQQQPQITFMQQADYYGSLSRSTTPSTDSTHTSTPLKNTLSSTPL